MGHRVRVPVEILFDSERHSTGQRTINAVVPLPFIGIAGVRIHENTNAGLCSIGLRVEAGAGQEQKSRADEKAVPHRSLSAALPQLTKMGLPIIHSLPSGPLT